MNITTRLVRHIVWIMIRFLYRIRVNNLAVIPETGAIILTPNHVTYLDAVIIAAHVKRPIRFAMHWKLFDRCRWVVEPLGAFPIAGKENPAVYKRAFEIMNETLTEGGAVCIFPEGMLTLDGKMNPFRNGVLKLSSSNPGALVIPIALVNFWGSYFSKQKPGFLKWPRHYMQKLTMRVGMPLGPITSPSDLLKHQAYIESMLE